MLCYKLGQGGIRVLFTAQRVINHGFAREFPPFVWFVLYFRERLLRLSFCDEN